jgi:hypothetical protein
MSPAESASSFAIAGGITAIFGNFVQSGLSGTIVTTDPF